jgi:hypothetical protein
MRLQGLFCSLQRFMLETPRVRRHQATVCKATSLLEWQGILVVTLSTQRGFPFSTAATNLPGRIAIQQGRYQ